MNLRNRNILNQVISLKQNIVDDNVPDGWTFTLALDPEKFFDPYKPEHIRHVGFKCRKTGDKEAFLEIEDWESYDIYLQSLRLENKLHPANTEELPEAPILADGTETTRAFLAKYFSL